MNFIAILTILSGLCFVDARPESYTEFAASHVDVSTPSFIKRATDCTSQCVGNLNQWGTKQVDDCAEGDNACICNASQWFTSGCIACLANVSSADALTQYYQKCNVIPDSITSTSSCFNLCQEYTAELDKISACGQDDGCICNAYYDIDISCINCRMVAEGQNQQGNAADFLSQCQALYPITSGNSSSSAAISSITTSAINSQSSALPSALPSTSTSSSSSMVAPSIPRPTATASSAFTTGTAAASVGSGAIPIEVVLHSLVLPAVVGIIAAHII